MYDLYYAVQCPQELDSIDEAFINGNLMNQDQSGRAHQGHL